VPRARLLKRTWPGRVPFPDQATCASSATRQRNAGAGAHERHTRHLDLVLGFAVGAEHIAVGETRGEPHHLVLLLMQGTAVGVDNMFKAKLFELFAIFTAAHVPRCT
jgi:hypothetical protein